MKTVIIGEAHRPARREDRPDDDWIRGRCPVCESDVVANCYYVGGKGYVLLWECWESLTEEPTCDYRRVL